VTAQGAGRLSHLAGFAGEGCYQERTQRGLEGRRRARFPNLFKSERVLNIVAFLNWGGGVDLAREWKALQGGCPTLPRLTGRSGQGGDRHREVLPWDRRAACVAVRGTAPRQPSLMVTRKVFRAVPYIEPKKQVSSPDTPPHYLKIHCAN
jgi:hypothetical protein